MRLRFPGASLAIALMFAFSACREKPASTVKEVNSLDAKAPGAPNPVEDTRFKEFSDRLRGYEQVHDAAEAKVPKLEDTSDPKKVSEREKALADEIRIHRAGAHQGDVFSPSAANEIRRVVEEDFNQRQLSDQKAILAEVPVTTPPAINTDYPTTMPLATVPPNLLLKLPTLPEVLEYRFLGRHLILRDVQANMTVDFIPDVVPATPAKSAGREAHP